MSRIARETRGNFAQGRGDMSDNFSISGISPLLTNSRFAPEYPMLRPPPIPDARGSVAVRQFRGALRRIVEQSSMRQARVRAIRAEIESGNYEPPAHLRHVDRLLDVIAEWLASPRKGFALNLI
jgi:hypothetical protein